MIRDKFSMGAISLLAVATFVSCNFPQAGPSDEAIRNTLLAEFKETPTPLTSVSQIERGNPVKGTSSLGLKRPAKLYPVRMRVTDHSGASYPMSYYFYQDERGEWQTIVNRLPPQPP